MIRLTSSRPVYLEPTETEAMNYLLQTETRRSRRNPEPNQPRRNLDVRQHGFDPFFSGMVIGAITTVVGMVLGWFLLWI
jgi:hypothetical protein